MPISMRKIDLTNFRLASSETARQINRRITLNFLRLHQPLSVPTWPADQVFSAARFRRSSIS